MSLTLSGITLGSGLTLQPAFDPQINEYTVDVPDGATSAQITFAKPVYDTVWGLEDALKASNPKKAPTTTVTVFPGGGTMPGNENWSPTNAQLHQDTYTKAFTFNQNMAAFIVTVYLNSGGTVKSTKITFNRVSA